LAKTSPLLVSFHPALQNRPEWAGKYNAETHRIIPHYFTERDHPWVKLYFDEFLRFQGKTRREVIQHFEGCLPFESPVQKRKFLYSVLERLSFEDDVNPEASNARKVRETLFLEAAKRPTKEVTHSILQTIAAQLNQQNLIDVIFSDLPLEKRLNSLPSTMSTQQLVLKANLYLIQRLLYKSASVRIHAKGNIRKVVRQAKLRRLICQVTAHDDGVATPLNENPKKLQ
jgi:predicted nuclease of restriction endonuclease-like RecB superfamily